MRCVEQRTSCVAAGEQCLNFPKWKLFDAALRNMLLAGALHALKLVANAPFAARVAKH
jgi:hypothetical protein